MFIQLTRLDNSPIWLNASFVVTVEPRKGGGSIVVPIGDGLDYDVKEKPEDVLARLAGAPAPAVVPVPARDALTQTPDDVSPETEAPSEPTSEAKAPAAAAEQPAEVPAEKAKTVRKSRTRTKTAAQEAEATADGDSAEEKPKPVRKTRARTKKTPLALDDGQLERLRKMTPRTVQRLKNTLVSQFKVEDADAQVKALVEHEVISLDQDHIIWPA